MKYLLSLCFLLAGLLSKAQPTLTWSKFFPGDMSGDFFFFSSDISLDTAGNAYFYADTAGSYGNFIGKVDKNGNLLWQINLMSGADTFGIRTITDKLGNTYGVKSNISGSALFKLSPEGNVVWMNAFIPSVNIYYFSLDSFGNLYALQNSQTASGNLYKYDTSGNLLWSVNLPYTTMWHAAIDKAGNIITTDGSVHLVKISATGTILWDQPITSIPNFGCYHLITDDQDNIIVDGRNQGSIDVTYYLGKYDSLGNLIWFITTDSTYQNIPISVAADHIGNVYSVMFFDDGNEHLLIRKFNLAGILQWSFVTPDTIFFDDGGYWFPDGPIRIDISGNAYVGTSTTDNAGFNSFTIYKFSPIGNLLWKVKEEDPSQYGDHLYDFKLGSQGSIYAIGKSGGSPQGIWMIKLSENLSGIAEENPNADLKVFPNPCDNVCQVNFKEAGHYELSVFNQFGQVFFTSNISFENVALLNTSTWTEGVYYLRCFDMKKNITYQSKIFKLD